MPNAKPHLLTSIDRATVFSLLLVLPLATMTGAFAGWASGSAVGEWLEYLGVTDATHWCGWVGGILGTVLCPAYVVRKVIRNATKTESERRDNPTSCN